MSRKKAFKRSVVAGLCATLFAGVAYAQPGYYISKIDIPGTLTANTTAFINNAGQIVVKDANDNSVGNTHYLIEEDGTITLFDDISVNNINDSGQVAGSCLVPQKVACIWDKEAGFTYIGGASYGSGFYTPTEARDINANGEVVGITPAGGWNAYTFLWDSESGTQIVASGWGNTIADNGTIELDTGMDAEFWQDGVKLHEVPGISYVRGINNNLMAYSTYSVWDPVDGLRGFSGNFRGSETANAINESNQIVGYRGSSASLWDDGEVFNLQDLLLDNPGWTLTYAYDNNNASQIVGRGTFDGEESLFLLTREPIAGPLPTDGDSYTFDTFSYAPLADRNTIVKDINGAGVILGSVAYGSPYRWSDANGFDFIIDNIGSSSYSVSVTHMSDAGDVAGFAANTLGLGSSYVWTTAGEQILVPNVHLPVDINNNDFVIAHPKNGAVSQLINYRTGSVTPVGTLNGIYSELRANALNDQQEVVGRARLTSGGYDTFIFDPVNGMSNLGLSGPAANVIEINENSQIIGHTVYMESTGSCQGHCAVTYTAATGWSVLPSFEPTLSNFARGINDAGVIVGKAYMPDGNGHLWRAVVWKEGQIYDLNALIEAGSGWYLSEAIDIHNDGTIIGKAFFEDDYTIKPFILTPGGGLIVDVCPSGCAYSSIQAAIDDKAYRGTVVVGDGTYNESVVLSKEKTLLSVNGPQVTTINAAGYNSSVVDMSVDSTIDGFTLTGGSASSGGGIRAVDHAVVRNMIITGNSATSGGGISANNTLLLENSTISNNSGGFGGGLNLSNGSVATLINNRFEGNSATDGGAIYKARNGAVTLEKNLLSGNSASRTGGGLYAFIGAAVTVNNSLIVNNSAGWYGGGGIYSRGWNTNITNSTVTGNSSSRWAGIYAPAGSVVLNSILWGNSGGNASTGLDIRYSISEFTGVGNVDADPLFVDAANGDYQLQAGSAAIDSASSANGITDDFDGTSRPQDGDGLGAGTTGDGSDYDMGAYEYAL